MTIYDIADIAGVSASTVSRVINNRPGVKKETREMVQRLLEEYNFTPNENARGLVNQVTKMIGILVADIRHSHHTEIAYVVERYLRSHGYCSLIINAGEEPDLIVESIQILENRKVDGVMLVGSVFQTPLIKSKIKQYLPKVPVVISNGYIDLPNVYGVLVDEKDGIKQCVDLLFEKGYQHIAFAGSATTVSSRQKQLGYQEGVLNQDPNAEIIIMDAGNTFNDGYEVAQAMIKKHPQIDAIICSEDMMAVGALRYFREHKINVPEQLGVIGVNNAIYGKISYPTLTSLDNRMKETGLVAATTLLEVLSGKKQLEKVMLFSKIIQRESTDRKNK